MIVFVLITEFNFYTVYKCGYSEMLACGKCSLLQRGVNEYSVRGVWPLVKLTAVKESCCLFALFKCIFYIFHLLPFNNTHILCLLSDVTSYTDSVASHSQSGYPNRKVHVFLFLKLVYKRRKNIP